MKTEALRYCIQAKYGKEDYAEARKELDALLSELARLTTSNEYANNLLDEQGAHINNQSLKISALTAGSESMQRDAANNTITVKMLMAQLAERDKEVLQLKEKVSYAYVQIEALEAK